MRHISLCYLGVPSKAFGGPWALGSCFGRILATSPVAHVSPVKVPFTYLNGKSGADLVRIPQRARTTARVLSRIHTHPPGPPCVVGYIGRRHGPAEIEMTQPFFAVIFATGRHSGTKMVMTTLNFVTRGPLPFGSPGPRWAPGMCVQRSWGFHPAASRCGATAYFTPI